MSRLFSKALDRTTPVDVNRKQTHPNELNRSLNIDKHSPVAKTLDHIKTEASNNNDKFDTSEFNNNTAGNKNLPNDHSLDDNILTHTATESLKITDNGGYLSNITQYINDIITSTRTFISNTSNNLTTSLTKKTTLYNMSGNLTQLNTATLTSVGIGGNSTNTTNTIPQDWMEMPKLDNFMDVFSLCCSAAVILGGLVPYIPQYLKIKRSSNSDGFSTYVCLTLLLANILRIAFWFGHHFELPLLLQSFVMIAGMLAMMEICVRVRTKNSPYIISAIGGRQNSSRSRYSVIGLYARHFWDWDDLYNYVKFLSLFTITLSLLTYSFIDSYLFVETLGFVAVFTESILGMPQLFCNYANKSTRGMSVEMVVMWFSGDLFKTMYFIFRHAPVQFIACGAIQVFVDTLILFQVFWYGRPNVTYSKLPKST